MMLTTAAYAYLDIDHPICAWATYRGVLVSVAPSGIESDLVGSISMMSASMLQSGSAARLNNELAIESIRKSRHPGRVSRLRGMYCFLDRESAEHAAALWVQGARNHFKKESLVELHLEVASRKDRVDSNWITYAKCDKNGFLLASELGQFDQYWEGRPYPGKSPIWETIIEGRMTILGTDLRNRAYEVIKREHPRSLALLEIARLAAWVGSDLGNIRARLQDDGENISLRYLQDMRDANNQTFLGELEKVKLDGHPINWADLRREMKHDSFGKTMDLRSYEFTRPKSELPFLRPESPMNKPSSMTEFPESLRIAGRLSAIENLLALLVLDRGRIDANPSVWIKQYISNIRRGVNLINQQPLSEDVADRLREETHKAILEFADLVELKYQELVETGQVADQSEGKIR